MADELTINASAVYSDADGSSADLQIVDLLKTIAGKKVTRLSQTIGITEGAVLMGNITAPGYAMFINRDPTNIVNLKVATGGAIFATLDPDTNSDKKGGVALLKLGSGAQVPFAIALVAPCKVDILIIGL